MAPFTVIVGEEVLSTGGEIIGYFLSEEIPRRLSPEETIERIKDQGGLVCIPHPFDRFRTRSHLRTEVLENLVSRIDLIEVFNSRTLLLRDSEQALQFARSHGLPGVAGSDAHVLEEIGRCTMEIPEFNDAVQFKQSILQSKIHRRRTTPVVHLYNIRNRLIKRLGRS